MAGVLFINPAAGRGDGNESLREMFRDHKIIEAQPQRFSDQVAAALTEGVDFVAVAGGDGTIRAAAEELRGGSVPLLPVPGGTRNHFAKDLGIDTFERAAETSVAGVVRRIDMGDVNGVGFINNSSLGLYPKLVAEREGREHRWPKWVANIAATYEQLRHGRRVEVEVDGTSYRAWMVFVGNGRYGDGLSDLADRGSLDDGVLDLRVVGADRALARTRVVLALLLGRLARSPLVFAATVTSVSLDVERHRVEVALDGEVEMLEPPLRYRSLPRTLPVLVPPPG